MEEISTDGDPRDIITDEIKAEIRRIFEDESDGDVILTRQTFTLDVYTAQRLPLDVISQLGTLLANFAYHWLEEDDIKTSTAFLTCDITELREMT